VFNDGGCAGIAPDESIGEGGSGRRVPNYSGLALVCDSYAHEVGDRVSFSKEPVGRLGNTVCYGPHDFRGVMLEPADERSAVEETWEGTLGAVGFG